MGKDTFTKEISIRLTGAVYDMLLAAGIKIDKSDDVAWAVSLNDISANFDTLRVMALEYDTATDSTTGLDLLALVRTHLIFADDAKTTNEMATEDRERGYPNPRDFVEVPTAIYFVG